MKDLTQGSIVSHISTMAPQIFAGMIMIMLCQLIDLYFVSGLGDAAIAGVAAAGNTGFLIGAFTQVLGVGTTSLISHAVGRKDQADANLIFNQALALSALCGIVALVAGSVLARPYMRSVAVNDAVVEAGTIYLLCSCRRWRCSSPCQMTSALRGTGIAADHDRPDHPGDHQHVLLPSSLAGTVGLWAAGAGLASSIAVVIGV